MLIYLSRHRKKGAQRQWSERLQPGEERSGRSANKTNKQNKTKQRRFSLQAFARRNTYGSSFQPVFQSVRFHAVS
jgi:hypothetical protein